MRTLRQALMAGVVVLTLWVLLAQAGVNDGLVGYWSFDNCDVRDDSGNGFDGGRRLGNPRCVAGAQGFAFEFDGNDFIRIPDVPVVPTQHSYAMWFRSPVDLDAGSPRQDLLYADVGEDAIALGQGRPHITLNHDMDGKIGFHPRIILPDGDVVTSNRIESTTTEWIADRWYHVAFTWDGSTFRTYIDGELQQTATLRSGLSFVYEGIVLAIRGDRAFPFTGGLDEVRIYDRAITTDEVRALANREFFSLTVITESLDEEGFGSVDVDPPGLACDDSCTRDYAAGTSVTLTALPDEGSEFAGWRGGGCSGTGRCTVDIDRTRTVRATFELRTFDLNIRKSGDGDGLVTSEPPGINCGDTCSNAYDPDTVVTLIAEPGPDSVFTGWSGSGCSGLGKCDVILSRNRTVTANFIGLYPLTVSKGGTEDGTIVSEPAGIDCGEDCEEIYESGTRVTLTATPGPTSSFDRWSGRGCSGDDPVCRVNVNRARDVTAHFELLRFRLRVSKTGTGDGSIVSEPRGINCGGDCGNTYDIGTIVTLTATPDDDSVFLGWEGGGCTGVGICTVTMSEELTVNGRFERLFPLTVRKNQIRDGDGLVTSEPLGIHCGDTCEQRYLNGTIVTLTATPGVNSRFAGWQGGGCSGDESICTVQMNQARTVRATFAPIEFQLNLTKAGTGNGTVNSQPGGINCGEDCGQSFDIGTEVTLTATPDSDSVFIGWSGACSGTDVCLVTMTDNVNVTATFEKVFSLTVRKTQVREADGTITSVPAGINCGEACEFRFLNDTSVTLTAVPTANARFVSWQGDGCSGDLPTCTVQMNQARMVRATFAPIEFQLSVTKIGTGSGTVNSQPSGVSCGEDCVRNFDINTEVTLTATPDTGSIFVGWGGACSGQEACTITITANTEVTATFESLFQVSLSKVRIGEGNGAVISSPAGIDCGETCQREFPHNTQVTLTAVPEADTRFVGWSGASCTGDTPCTIFVTTRVAMTATFENPPPTASAGLDQIVDEGVVVTLDASNSTDFNAAVDRFAWSQQSGPPVTLSDASAAQPTFTAPSVLENGAILEFLLEVFDARGLSATDLVQVTVLDTNVPPLANAGPDRMVEERTIVTLDGSLSSDMDGTLENIIWTQVEGSPVILSDPTALNPTFTAPIVGLNAGFEPGDTLPGFVLRYEPQGSIADIQAQGSYHSAQWSVMFTRALQTLDVEGDVQFDLANPDHLYAFSIAYLDNTGAAPPQAAAAAVMSTQDTRPYTLGNLDSGADLRAPQETPADCAAFSGPPLVTAPNNPSVVPAMTIRAAFDATHVYLCVTAPDPNGHADERKALWEFIGPQPTQWEQKPASVNVMGGASGTFDEDRIAIWWDINAQDFATEGCFALCHDQRMQSRNPDGRADLWHWKAARTNPAGFAGDERLHSDPAQCPEQPCRQPDTALLPMTIANQRMVDTTPYPAFITPERPDSALRFLFADRLPPTCLPGVCALSVPATLFGEVLQFDLTVVDDGDLADTDDVSLEIVESGGHDSDADGIMNDVEDLAPNNGDGNADGIPDRRQSHVASFPNLIDGAYLTLASEPDTALLDVRAVPHPSPSDAPPDITFPSGFQAFVVRGLSPGAATTVTLFTPPDVTPTTFYKFGVTPDNSTLHWYEFLFDGTTGAEILNDRIVLHFVDGQRGDDDLMANGEIFDPSAIAVATPPPPPAPPTTPPALIPPAGRSGGGGGGGGCTLNPDAPLDLTLLLVLGIITIYLAWRRRARPSGS